MTVERETKLDVGPGFRLPGFEGVRRGLRATRREPERTRTVYWDTEDLRLARWGCSLRFRDGQGWTLKLPRASRDGALRRDEIEAEGASTPPPESLVELVTGYVRGAELGPSVTLSTVRTRIAFTGADRVPIGEVVDDEVAVLDGRRIAARFREVEVETHDDVLAGAAIARLRAAGAGETVLTPKYLRALGARPVDPPELRSTERLGREATVLDAISNALSVSAIRLVRADAVVRLDEDPEGVHGARVAVRRLRSDLRTFRSLLVTDRTDPLRKELRWLGRALRDVRDLDVLGERITAHVADLPPRDRPAGERLVDRVRGERADARARLAEELASQRYRTLLDRVIEAAASPAVRPEVAAERASAAMEPLMDGPWQHVATASLGLEPDSPDEDLHAARIRAKRARYAAEALAPVVGRRARTFAAAAADLQDVLGEHQDAVVAGAWMRAAAREAPSVAFAAGYLAAREDRERARARKRWPKAWKRLRRTKERSWP